MTTDNDDGMFSTAFAHLRQCGSTARFRALVEPVRVIKAVDEDDDDPFAGLGILRHRVDDDLVVANARLDHIAARMRRHLGVRNSDED